MHQVDARTRAALANAQTARDRIHITGQLAGDVWRSVARVLILLGGRYETNRSAFIFEFDPRPALRAVIASGMCFSATKDDGYVPTPDWLAEQLTTTCPFSDLARMPPGSRILEPSAGDGQIVRAILEANDELHVVAVEPNTARAAKLDGHPDRVTVIDTTFEEYAAGPGRAELFDGVVMNPPFSAPGQPALWIDHVMTAWNMLEPGGRLVAVVPNGFSFRRDRQHKDVRRLVEDFGGWENLPDDTFDGLKTCVIWMARPVRGHEGLPPYLFRHYPDAIEPVPVRYPWLTTRAVQEAPVQVWHDPSTNRERVFRYRAQCWGCGWLLWQFDGNDDMALGEHAAPASLDADEDGKVGPTIGLCITCANTSDTKRAAEKAAHEIWKSPPTKTVPVSVWSLLLWSGGMLPVSDLERERHTRVQAAMRAAFGLSEHTPETDLIDVQQAWRGGRDRLAARYLQAYADRLDVDADLDDVDRAALLWRSDRYAPPIEVAETSDPWGVMFGQMHLDLGAAI
ncbi:methyltransferase [Actinoplanes derwentensis]|uniref:Methyltransferase domain-containing protein n=1 Tax=Actinoplanes derwentensis TaxID=113562 RepID=A0A1H2CUS5_9ACTN|nr:class I SAM-dependent methyltransferase [Actinoplanes derwentensis]GID81961.1 hypothetical protein Ade03nite_08850 [Actinoplanes derwentensis]SDT74211.1 Methyltransferase domain-containing protein [Actinoplanes derwentensis]